MHKLPLLSGKEIVSILEKDGFIGIRQKGSHFVMRKVVADHVWVCVVPMHKEVKIGVLKSILKQANISADYFLLLSKNII